MTVNLDGAVKWKKLKHCDETVTREIDWIKKSKQCIPVIFDLLK